MRFQHEMIEALRAGRKHSTRRLRKKGERLVYYAPRSEGEDLHGYWSDEKAGSFTIPTVVKVDDEDDPETGGRIVRQVGRWYAIQEGRKTLGRFRLDGITLERLQDITEEGARDEGFPSLNEFIAY